MTELPALPESFDLVAASMDSGVAISFPKSKSGAYPTAVNICRGAASYNEADIEGVTMHFVTFGKSRAEMARSLAAISSLRGYKGLLIYSGGRLQEWARAIKVLQCYSDAEACNDPAAHCVISVHRDSITTHAVRQAVSIDITPDFMAATSQGKAMLFPCRLLAMSFGFKIQGGHPSSEADQVQAGAVREGCAWCPNFRSVIE